MSWNLQRISNASGRNQLPFTYVDTANNTLER